jgi:hypothetical protein
MLQKDENGKRKPFNNDELPAIPCGLVAKSIFNDTFRLYREDNTGQRTPITIETKGIAWSSDI